METALNDGEWVSRTTNSDAGHEVAKAFKISLQTARRTFHRFTCKGDLICRVTGAEARGAEQVCKYCGLPRSPVAQP